MKECRLLYSMDDMKRFIDFFDENICDLRSMRMDGQRVFIVTFDENRPLEQFEELIEKSKPTMLGCIDSEDLNLRKETIESLRNYVKELESENEVLPDQRKKHTTAFREGGKERVAKI